MDIVEQLYKNVYIADVNTFHAQHSPRWLEFDNWLRNKLPVYNNYESEVWGGTKKPCWCLGIRDSDQAEEELLELQWGHKGPTLYHKTGGYSWWYRCQALYIYDLKMWLIFRNSAEHGPVSIKVLKRMLFEPPPKRRKHSLMKTFKGFFYEKT